MPVRVVGAYRQTEIRLRDPLALTVNDLAHAELARQAMVGPLAFEEAVQLLDALLAGVEDESAALRERLLQRANAVPFFLLSCARGLRSGALQPLAADGIPWDLAQSIQQRVAALPEPAQALLDAAAVIGRRVPYGLLLTVARRPEEEVLVELEAVGRAHLLEEEGPDAYLFPHDVIREVLEANLGARRRAILHWRIAEALEQGEGAQQVELLAYHYARSDAQDKAAIYLERAGERAQAQYANAAAEGYYQDLVERLDRLGRTLDGARVRERLGLVLRTAGRYDQAMAVLEQAAETYRASGDLDSLGRVMARLGRLYVMRLQMEEGIQRLQPLLESMEASGPSHGLAAMEAALAHLFFATGRYREQLAAAERAMALARRLGHDQILVEAADRRGLALLMMSRVKEALQMLEEAQRLAEATSELDSLRRTLSNLARIHRDRGDLDRARTYLERALAVAHQQGDPAQVATLTSYRCELDFYQGAWERAWMDSGRALRMAREMGTSWSLGHVLVHHAQLCLATGSQETARGHLEEMLSIPGVRGNSSLHSQEPWRAGGPAADRRVAGASTHVQRVLAPNMLSILGHTDLHVLRPAYRLLAECDILEGQPETARARLLPLLDRPGLEEWDVTALLPTLAWAHLDLGDPVQAEDTLALAFRRARAGNHRLALAEALRVQALLALRQERWVEAERALDEGLALAEQMPYPYAEGRLLHLYGRMHGRKGERGPALERLEAALMIFQRLGARRDMEQAQQDLAALPR